MPAAVADAPGHAVVDCAYRFVLELQAVDGTVLHRESLEPDWEPAIEAARLTGLRRLGIWPQTGGSGLAVVPVWHEGAGPPIMQAFRVLVSTERHAWSADFKTSNYFSETANALVAAQLAEGRLSPTESVGYAVAAYSADARTSPGPRLRLSLVDRPQPLAVYERGFSVLVVGSTACGETDPSDFEVVVPQALIDEAYALTNAAGDCETGGVLIGHLCRNEDRGDTSDIGIEVTAQIPARHAVGRTEKLTFTSDTWTDVRNAVDLRRRGELMLGWWHSHPAFKWCEECPIERQRVCRFGQGFLSADDKALHRSVFPSAFTQALVVTRSVAGIGTRLFGWRNGVLQPRGFRVSGCAAGEKGESDAASVACGG